MNKTWRVARYEYLQHVRTKRFIMALLSFPLIILLAGAISVLAVSIQMKNDPIGYVDHAGILAEPVAIPTVLFGEKEVEIHAYGSEAEAEAAVAAGTIQGYYIIPADYTTSGQMTLVQAGNIREMARLQFYRLVRFNLLRGEDPAKVERIMDGIYIATETPDASRSLSLTNWFSTVLPLLAGILFIVALFSTGGYLLQAVVDEKENRTMEVIMTSVSPGQFMTGKIIGDTAVGLTQLLVWGVCAAAVILVVGQFIHILDGLTFSIRSIIIYAVILFPTFLTNAALMAAVGATVTEASEGQSVSGWFSMPIWIPYFVSPFIIGSPNGPLSVVLSMLPLTAPLSMLMRDGVAVVPAWQIALSGLIQVGCTVFAFWLAGRAFRLGMLRYGKRLKLRELFTRRTGEARL